MFLSFRFPLRLAFFLNFSLVVSVFYVTLHKTKPHRGKKGFITECTCIIIVCGPNVSQCLFSSFLLYFIDVVENESSFFMNFMIISIVDVVVGGAFLLFIFHEGCKTKYSTAPIF